MIYDCLNKLDINLFHWPCFWSPLLQVHPILVSLIWKDRQNTLILKPMPCLHKYQPENYKFKYRIIKLYKTIKLIFTQRWTLAWWAIFELEEERKNTWRIGKVKPKRDRRDEKQLHHRRRKVEMMTRFLDTPFIPSSFFLLSFNFPSFTAFS